MSPSGQIEQFVQMVRYVWRDSRVPVLARIYVVLAPLYWINPFDLIPDLQPGGHCDDITVFCLLVIMALRLVPREVFRDSHKAKLLGKKAAAFGMLYVTVAGSSPVHAHASHSLKASPAHILGSSVFIDFFTSPETNDQSPQVKTTAPSYYNQDSNPRQFSRSDCLSVLYVPKALMPVIILGRDLLVDRHGPLTLLVTRGGQSQLYASEDASTSIIAAKLQCSFQSPPQIAGGVFVAQPLFGEDQCLTES